MTAIRLEATSPPPDLDIEDALLSGRPHGWVAGVDEVGRGALAGPVSVGAVLVGWRWPPMPPGVRDSKMLTAPTRTRLAGQVRTWARAVAVGHAWAGEVDELGVVAALGLAARRALAELPQHPEWVLLDGDRDYIGGPGCRRRPDVTRQPGGTPPAGASDPDPVGPDRDPAGPAYRVRTLVRADARCASVAAASIVAKTVRDELMQTLGGAYPVYGWARNRGYPTPAHVAAVRTWGTSPHHRLSWRLPDRVAGGCGAGTVDNALVHADAPPGRAHQGGEP